MQREMNFFLVLGEGCEIINKNGQPPQIQPENGNNSRVQALEAEDVRLQQLISDLGPSGGPKGDTRATGHYWSRA